MSDLNSLILALDKQQRRDSAERRICKVDRDHGALGVHGSGSLLLCTAKGCNYKEPASIKD